jgi:histone deacetylase complex regulatory component SIN3
MIDVLLISQLAKKNVMTIQLLGKGDTTIDDAVTTQEKWQQYVDSYTLVSHPFICAECHD